MKKLRLPSTEKVKIKQKESFYFKIGYNIDQFFYCINRCLAAKEILKCLMIFALIVMMRLLQ